MTAENEPAPLRYQRLRGKALGLLVVLCGAAFLEGVDIAMSCSMSLCWLSGLTSGSPLRSWSG